MLKEGKPKVFVAMSGGVDSSVAAALLYKQGFDVVGVFFKPWSPPATHEGIATRPHGAGSYQLPATNSCLWEQDRQDAMRVCVKLDIPFKTWDFSKEYGKRVAQYMIDSYRAGTTPNPDAMCNKEIKFGLFLKRALTEGTDYIVTGHYVRLRRKFPIKSKNKNSKNYKLQTMNYKLLKGVDKNKDQSYFLWTLTQEQLKHCLFPIGNYTKPEVRKLAKKFGLPNYDKKDSQGVCFVGQLDIKDFLKNYIKPSRGEIRLVSSTHDRDKMKPRQKENDEAGIRMSRHRIVGHHDGVYYYTIGQRHGLDIKDGKGPYYVIGKDVQKNILFVTNETNRKQPIPSRTNLPRGEAKLLLRGDTASRLTVNDGEIKNANWIIEEPKLPLNCQVKIRYRTRSVPATITRMASIQGPSLQGRSLYKIKFKKPVRALAPGQSAVFYRGQEILGGGIIK